MIGPVVLTLPLILGAAQDNVPPNWKLHETPEGRFAVAMPGTPVKKEQQVKTAKGELRVTIWIAEGRLDSSFVVSYTDYAKADAKPEDEDKRLEQACKGAIEKSRGKLRGEARSIKLDGKHPGREIMIEKDGEVIARMRIYLVENRLFQVMVLGGGPVFASKEKDVGVFLDSFRLIK
ncbi:MAG: hypothetical protein FJ303_15995 [Planctomycetes bacterium]|nr:hypothetical protein [Planctomycetota bacterium]